MLESFFTPEEWTKIHSRAIFLEKELSKDSLDYNQRREFQKEYSVVSDISNRHNTFKELSQTELSLKEELNLLDKSTQQEFISLLNEELTSIENQKIEIFNELEEIIFPGDENAKRAIFIEIRAGTGGLEASLFAGDLARMYLAYGEKKHWEASITSIAETDVGGIREMILYIKGRGAYDELRHEAGVHRVQRVPETEGSGRVHTSTAVVAVLPEAEDAEISIDPGDLRIDTYRASGAGGQHVNKTDSAVRITHIPTNTVVQCQEERSQHKNRARAMKMLQSKLLSVEKEKKEQEIGKMRKEMSGSAERSDKVRTYNFPQNRVTDHQIDLTLNKLEYILQGDLDEIISGLIKYGKKGRQKHPLLVQLLS